MNKKVKGLIQRLGEAIHETVSESEHVAGVVKDIREQGFDVMLMLEATIGLNEVHESETPGDGESAEEGDAPFTPHDLNFLRSLRISVTEGEPASDPPLDPLALPNDNASTENTP